MTEAILLSTTRVMTSRNRQVLTAASGFYFASGDRLFLVTNRHVLCSEASQLAASGFVHLVLGSDAVLAGFMVGLAHGLSVHMSVQQGQGAGGEKGGGLNPCWSVEVAGPLLRVRCAPGARG